jgi:hypothetical protein
MIELVFIVCMSITPDICEERTLAYHPEVGLQACMTQAQPQLAKWQETHPGLTITRWTCVWSDAREIEA